MKQLIVVIIAAVLLAGCEKKENGGVAVTGEKSATTCTATERTYAELATNDVIVKVNGHALTKGELEREIEFRLRMLELRPNKFGRKPSQEKLRRQLELTCDRQFLQQVLFTEYAQKAGLKVEDADREAMHKKLIAAFTNGGNAKTLSKKLSSIDVRILSENVNREILIGKGREKLIADNQKPVTEKDISARRKFFEDYNMRAIAENAATYQKATNIWKKLQAGYPFERMVSDYEDDSTPHISADGNWGDFRISDFKDDTGLINAVKSTPAGFYTPPFEGDNGLMIIKVLEVLPIDAKANRDEPYYRLAKIFFELPEIWEVETDEELRADLEKIHRREALAKGIKALTDSAKIEYPNGTNLFPKKTKKSPSLPPFVRNRIPKNIKVNQ